MRAQTVLVGAATVIVLCVVASCANAQFGGGFSAGGGSLFSGGSLTLQYQPHSFPVAVIAYNRPDYLRRTLESLLKAEGVDTTQIVIYQDGYDEGVDRVAQEFVASHGMRHVQHPRVLIRSEGAEFIADMYAFVLQHVFAEFPETKHAVILEDDLEVATDILWYFSMMAPLLDREEGEHTSVEVDPTVMAISAYNDNGFEGRVRFTNQMHRTNYFVGLGWLCSRWLAEELLPQWPSTHWDMWIRKPAIAKNRVTLYPEISRVYHFGEVGTHTSLVPSTMYSRIVLATSGSRILDWRRFREADYDAHLQQQLVSAVSVSSMDELEAVADMVTSQPVVMWLSLGKDEEIWQFVASVFELWPNSKPIRNSYKGVIPLWYRERRLYFVLDTSLFAGLRPATVSVIPANYWHRMELSQLNESCEDACWRHKLHCVPALFFAFNQCASLRKVFTCASCTEKDADIGPGFEMQDRSCVVDRGLDGSRESNCSRRSATFHQLCPCARETPSGRWTLVSRAPAPTTLQ